WLVEGLLGEALVDDWVAAVETTRLPRSGPLRVVQPSSEDAPNHSLAELPALFARATRAVAEILPDKPYCSAPAGSDWALLEMEPDPSGAQPDRLSAATWLPELLKGALEGLPFHSSR